MANPQNPDDDDAAASGADPMSTLNQQILGAVEASTQYAFGLNSTMQDSVGKERLSAGVAVAYDKAAQAAALGVQDATDYARNVLSISAAAQGKALAMILANVNTKEATQAFVFALIASIVAPVVVAETGIAQTTMLKAFPQG